MHDASESAESPYIFANAESPAADRFSGLAAVYDPGTVRHLTALGVGPGWRCLEVGAGGGSVARWLSARVGPTGHVLVTDIDTRYLVDLSEANLTVQQHDISRDPLPTAAFDLVHVRLVLLHVPEREAALARMVAALRPGGWLLAEEYDALSLLPDPAQFPGERVFKLEQGQQRLMRTRGADTTYGRRLPERFAAHGLADIGAEGHLAFWPGGSAGAHIKRANYLQIREALLETGAVSPAELADEFAALEDPHTRLLSPVLWSVWGQRRR
jgi:SAM-dependent methyltransferase